jgi:hypothetical protein
METRVQAIQDLLLSETADVFSVLAFGNKFSPNAAMMQ